MLDYRRRALETQTRRPRCRSLQFQNTCLVRPRSPTAPSCERPRNADARDHRQENSSRSRFQRAHLPFSSKTKAGTCFGGSGSAPYLVILRRLGRSSVARDRPGRPSPGRSLLPTGHQPNCTAGRSAFRRVPATSHGEWQTLARSSLSVERRFSFCPRSFLVHTIPCVSLRVRLPRVQPPR